MFNKTSGCVLLFKISFKVFLTLTTFVGIFSSNEILFPKELIISLISVLNEKEFSISAKSTLCIKGLSFVKVLTKVSPESESEFFNT